MPQTPRADSRERATGFQVAQLGVAAQLRAWREQLGDEEYPDLLEVFRLFLEREQRELVRSRRRWRLRLVA
jgi:hypothetical protein